jgi:hypothetical protein
MEPNSNEKDMAVINLGGAPIDSLSFTAELGHEFAHLIQWSIDPNEDLWMNEAMSELSAFMTVSPEAGTVMQEPNQQVFAEMPYVQLTNRPTTYRPEDDPYSIYAHYGGEKLFSIYLLDWFGPLFIKNLVANEQPGVRALNEELGKLNPPETFDHVFSEWILANLLNQPFHSKGRFGYREVSTLLPYIVALDKFSGKTETGYTSPYSSLYYEFHAQDNLRVDFSGESMARLTAADPYDGDYVWYSNRGDQTSFTLTRSFDLTNVNSATLNYSVWYELEKDFDYGYVLASGDDGATWDVLPTKYGMVENLSSSAYGIGYTGESKQWRKESLDLSGYAGKNVLVRFAVFTDLGTNMAGMQLDNISIPEIGYFDGAEDNEGGWETQGFVRSSNLVPVNWVVWIVKVSIDPAVEDEVIRLDMDELQKASIELDGFGKDFDFAAMVISPLAPTTTMDIDYDLTLTGK